MMTRKAITTLCLFAGLAAWAGAQPASTAGLSPGEQLRLLNNNSALLIDLVERGISVSEATTALTRAEECRRTADRLADELRNALTRSDADRVAEIGDHLRSVYKDGLSPNLQLARQQIHPGSPDHDKLVEVQTLATKGLSDLQQTFPAQGEMSKSRRVQETREKLKQAAAEIAPQ